MRDVELYQQLLGVISPTMVNDALFLRLCDVLGHPQWAMNP